LSYLILNGSRINQLSNRNRRGERIATDFPKSSDFVFCPGVGGQETSTRNEPGKRILFVCLFYLLSSRKALPDLKLCPAYVLSIENRRIKILSWKQARGNRRFVVGLAVVVKTGWIKILTRSRIR